jgi:GTPase SAR1 family protein
MKDINTHELFFPSQHITEPKWFAGRKNDIENALNSLYLSGASMIVFGERGSGKTSFTEMIKLLASGNTELLFKHQLHKKFDPKKLKYKIISFTCNEACKTTAKVLQNLITNPHGIKKIIPEQEVSKEVSQKVKAVLGALNMFSFGIQEEVTTKTKKYAEGDIFELFTNLVETISSEILSKDESLLIVIDEFDLVEDSEKIASLIKTLSKDNVKFLLCGIADSYESLIMGHRSITRQIMYGRIHIGLMTESEIGEVFKLVSNNTNNKIRFDAGFIKEVALRSNGYPYYVQLFGKLAMDDAISSSGEVTPLIVNRKHLISGIKKLSYFEVQMESDYLEIIGDNPQKELALKYLAKQTSKRIKDEDLFNYLHKKKVLSPNSKNILKSLLAQREPQFLLREKEGSPYICFQDPIFKTYTNSRDAELLKFENNEYVLP